jgi:hypothetical protein
MACFPFFTFFDSFLRFGSSRYRRATLAIELGGRSIYLNGLLRYRGASFHRYFATLALFTFTLRRLGATLAIERGRLHVEVDLTVDLIYPNGFFRYRGASFNRCFGTLSVARAG